VKFLSWLLSVIFGDYATPEVPYAPDPPPQGWTPPNKPEPEEVTAELFTLFNKARIEANRSGLSFDYNLVKAAQAHALWMAANRKTLHKEQDGPAFAGYTLADRMAAQHYVAGEAAEVIASGQRDSEEAFDSWMHSPPHRDSILDDNYWHVGFGAASDEHGHLYWCAVLGRPRGSYLSHLRRQLTVRALLLKLPPPLIRHPAK
jgi:uncharacterized protein YkwD